VINLVKLLYGLLTFVGVVIVLTRNAKALKRIESGLFEELIEKWGVFVQVFLLNVVGLHDLLDVGRYALAHLKSEAFMACPKAFYTELKVIAYLISRLQMFNQGFNQFSRSKYFYNVFARLSIEDYWLGLVGKSYLRLVSFKPS